MLNLEKQKFQVTYEKHENFLGFYAFGLGSKVIVEQRRVQSLPVLFGDIAGMKEFLMFFFSFLLERYTDSMKLFSYVDAIYRVTASDDYSDLNRKNSATLPSF